MLNKLWQSAFATELVIPSHEMLLLLVLLTLALLFRRIHIGLLTTFIFVYRWGWIFFSEHLLKDNFTYFIVYYAAGLTIIVLAAFRIWSTPED
jgi:hypothetical protein